MLGEFNDKGGSAGGSKGDENRENCMLELCAIKCLKSDGATVVE